MTIRKLRVVEVLCEDEYRCSVDCKMMGLGCRCNGVSLEIEAPDDSNGWSPSVFRTESCKREALTPGINAVTGILFSARTKLSQELGMPLQTSESIVAHVNEQKARIEQLERELAEERARR